MRQVSHRFVYTDAHRARHYGLGKVRPSYVYKVSSVDRLLSSREVAELEVMLFAEKSNVFVDYKLFVFFGEL